MIKVNQFVKKQLDCQKDNTKSLAVVISTHVNQHLQLQLKMSHTHLRQTLHLQMKTLK